MTLVRSKFIARSSSSKLTSSSISRAIAISFSSFASSFARIALLKLASSIWPNFKKIDLNLSFKISLLSFLSSKAFFVPPFLLQVLNIKSIVSFTSSSKFLFFYFAHIRFLQCKQMNKVSSWYKLISKIFYD